MQKKRSKSAAKPQTPPPTVQITVAETGKSSQTESTTKKLKSISTQLGPHNTSFIKQKLPTPARQTRTKVKRSYRFESASPTQSSTLHGSHNKPAVQKNPPPVQQIARSGSAGNNVPPMRVTKSDSFRSDCGSYNTAAEDSFEAKARANALKLESRLRQWSEQNAAADGFRVKLKKQPAQM